MKHLPLIGLSLLTLGCSPNLINPSPVSVTYSKGKSKTATCTISLDTNIQGHSEDRGVWVKAFLTPSEPGACGSGCGDVGCPVWSFDIPPSSYQICPIHADTFNPPCTSRAGKYLHILGGPGEYVVTASIAGVQDSMIIIVGAFQ